MSHSNGAAAPPPPTSLPPGGREALVSRLTKQLTRKRDPLEVDKIFRALVKLEGSDLHLKVGSPPMVRVKGELRPLNRGPIDNEEMVRLLIPMMDDRNLMILNARAVPTLRISVRLTASIGASVSTCSSNLARSVWSHVVSATLSLTSVGCFCPIRLNSFATTIKAWCCLPV